MVSRPFAAVLVSGLLALTGCASNDGLQFSTTFDPLTPFPAQATYKWDENRNSLPDNPRLQNLDLSQLIMESSDAEFARRGYTVTSSSDPDFLANYQLSVSRFIAGDESKAIASLSIGLVDAKTRQRVWVAFARTELHIGNTQEQRRVALGKAMNQILAKFPPNQPQS